MCEFNEERLSNPHVDVPTTISSSHPLNQNSEQEEDDISQPFFKLQTAGRHGYTYGSCGKIYIHIVPDWLNTEF